jgi:hypothetical protein
MTLGPAIHPLNQTKSRISGLGNCQLSEQAKLNGADSTLVDEYAWWPAIRFSRIGVAGFDTCASKLQPPVILFPRFHFVVVTTGIVRVTELTSNRRISFAAANIECAEHGPKWLSLQPANLAPLTG